MEVTEEYASPPKTPKPTEGPAFDFGLGGWLVALTIAGGTVLTVLYTGLPTTNVAFNYPLGFDAAFFLLALGGLKALGRAIHAAKIDRARLDETGDGELRAESLRFLRSKAALVFMAFLGGLAGGALVQGILHLTQTTHEFPYPQLNVLFGASHGMLIGPSIIALRETFSTARACRRASVLSIGHRSGLVNFAPAAENVVGWALWLLFVDIVILAATPNVSSELSAWALGFFFVAVAYVLGMGLMATRAVRQAMLDGRSQRLDTALKLYERSEESYLREGGRHESSAIQVVAAYAIVRQLQAFDPWPLGPTILWKLIVPMSIALCGAILNLLLGPFGGA